MKTLPNQKTKYFHVYQQSLNIKINRYSKDDTVHLNHIIVMLIRKGFTVQIDKEMLERFSIIADNYLEGVMGQLAFKAKIYPNSYNIEFYDVNSENKHRRVDVNDLPYITRLQSQIAMESIQKYLLSQGYSDKTKPTYKYADDIIRHRIMSSCHYIAGKELKSFDFEKHNILDTNDRDGTPMHNGDTKYYRDYKGRLMRGIVYHNINNMWHVKIDKYTVRNIAAFELFDIQSKEDLIPKVYSHEIPARIQIQKLRDIFNEFFSYKDITLENINELNRLISTECTHSKSDISLTLRKPLKKHTKILKSKGLVYSFIRVDGDYFKDREAISFNEDGFIGFAGWASEENLTPFIRAFYNWLVYLNRVCTK